MKYAVCAVACALLVAGCNKGREVKAKDASVAEVAQKVHEAGADQMTIRPGLWQSKVTIDEFDMPGMPAEMRDRMKTMMGQQQEHRSQSCLTPEDVKRPKEDFFAGKSKECRYDHFTMGRGKIDAMMHCGKGDEAQVMQMAGTYSPESYQLQMAMKMSAAEGEANGMSMKMRVEAQRVGECPANG
jgi:hypothetical protein